MELRERDAVQEALAQEIDDLVFGVYRRLYAFREAQLAELDLTLPQALVLRRLQAPAPMHEIAGRLGCKASNVTGIVDRLEARGLVRRQTPKGDRRVKQIALTAAGETLRRQVEAPMSSMPDALSDSDRLALRDLLRRFVGELPPGDEAPCGE